MARSTQDIGIVYQRADGRWAGTLNLPPSHDGRRRRKVVYGKTQAEAETKLGKAHRALKRDRDIKTRVPTVAEWADTYYKRCEQDGTLALSTLKGYRQKVRTIVTPAIGKIRLDALTPQHVRQVHAQAVADGRSPTNKQQAHVILSGLLSAAMEDEWIRENVCSRMKTPRAAHFDAETLTAAQSIALLDWAKGREWHDLRVSVALLAGLRSGEALGLTRQAVNLENGTLDVAWQLQRVPPGAKPSSTRPAHHVDGNYWLLEPKADASRRGVPMMPRLHDLMEERLAEMPDDPWALVFTGARGGPMSHERDWARWRQALDGAGVPRIRRHDARHTAATLLREAKVDPRVIQAILGHSTAAMTAHYSHLGAGERSEAVAQYGALLGIASQ